MPPDGAAQAEQLLRAITDGHRHRVAAAAERARAALERADRAGAAARSVDAVQPEDEEDYSTRTWLS